jgi:hypothetical protein
VDVNVVVEHAAAQSSAAAAAIRAARRDARQIAEVALACALAR